MFGVEDFVSRGYKELSDGPATTELVCKWSVPRGPAVTPMQLNKVTIKKNVPGKITRAKTFSAATYNPLPVEKRKVDIDRLTQLHHALGMINKNLPWVRAIAPAIVAEHKTITCPISKGATNLRNTICGNDPVIIPAKCCENETNKNPPTLTDKIKVQINDKIIRDSVKYSAEERHKIEEITREQSRTPLWFKYRKGRITASKFQQNDSHINVIQKKGQTSTTENLVESFVKGNKFKGNSATLYGQQQEPLAVEAYKKTQFTNHTNFRVVESGLVISEKFPFLGASPDRIVSCDCHGKRLLEVKCPYTLIDKARSIESLDFFKVVGDSLSLKKAGNSDYAQIQGQMGVTGIGQCDFVVFDGRRVVTVNVLFDETFWKTLALKLDQFHYQYIFPTLVESVRGKKHDILTERRSVQNEVSEVTKMFPCGKCGQLLANQVTNNHDASIQCECNCGCQQWYHWRCVNYSPDPENFDEEPAWYCVSCVRNCDIAV